MEENFTKLKGSVIEYTVKLSEKEFGPHLNKAFSHLASHLELPGFRKGKAPRELVLQKIGEFSLYEEAAEDAIKEIYLEAVEKNNWQPIGRPEVTVLKLAPKTPFEFKVVFAVMPEVKLPENYQIEIKKLKKQKKKILISEKEIEDSLDWLVRSRSSFKEVTRPAKKKDWIIVDLKLSHQNQPVAGGLQNDFRFNLNDSSLLPGFGEKILGSSTGDKLCFSLAVPKDYWNKEVAGKEIDFDVQVKKIEEEVLPELNDDFAKSLGDFTDLESLKTNLRNGLIKEKLGKDKEAFRLLILKTISDSSEIDLPQVLLDKEKESMLQELRLSLENNGLDWQAYLSQIGKTEEGIKKEFELQAIERIKFSLILEEIAKKEKIEPTQEEIELEANKVLARFKSIKEAEKSIDAYQLTTYTKSIIQNEKVSQFLEKIVLAE